jgi:hypothetical protein
MISWIESQESAVIILLVIGFCYALAATIFIAMDVMSRGRVATALKATTPVMLTPLSVLTGLLIAFLASRVWTNLDHANAYVAQEASAIRQSVLLADTLPADTRVAFRAGVKEYLHFVEAEDWPAMAANRANLRRPGLTDVMATLLSFVPTTPGQQLAQQHAVGAIEQALEARRNRILLSKASISPLQWAVIIVLFVMILLTTAMVHLDKRLTMALNLFIISTAIAASLVVLMVNDRPFTSGGITLEPQALREISPE